jgi:uncharacterized membrane protein
MIYYPLSLLILAGIKNIILISDSESIKKFKELFKNLKYLGVDISYLIQKEPNGIPECFLIAKDKIQDKEKDKNKAFELFKYEGYIMILLAAFTEALIYFVVRRIKTDNSWNHLFISYFFGALLMTIIFFNKIKDIKLESRLTLSIIINIIIGLFGYLLRFYAISNLDANIYAPLSYFGILMAYIYGVIFNNDKISIMKIIGTLFIIIPNIYVIQKTKNIWE